MCLGSLLALTMACAPEQDEEVLAGPDFAAGPEDEAPGASISCGPGLRDAVAVASRDHLGEHWGWASGVALYGYAQLDDDDFLEANLDWASTHAAALELGHVNQLAPGWAWLDGFARTGDPEQLAAAEALAEHFVHSHPRGAGGAWLHAGHGVWVDTMFMAGPYLAELHRLGGDPRWRDEAMLQLEAHAQLLWDPDAGLFVHGVPDGKQAEPDADALGSGVYWGRGNAWAALATAEVLARTEGGEQRDALELRLRRHLGALLELRDPAGGWRTVLDDPEAYVESSATAGIARAFLLAGQLGAVDPAVADAVVRDACDLLGSRTVGGELMGVSDSTALGSGPGDYRTIPNEAPRAWGQGLWLALLIDASP